MSNPGDTGIKIEAVPIMTPSAREHHLRWLGLSPVKYVTREELERLYPSAQKPEDKR